MSDYKEAVRNFKIRFLLTALAKKRFNLSSVCREFNINRNTARSLLPKGRKKLIELARKLEIF